MIRYWTNKVINLIGDDYNNTLQNVSKNIPNNLNDKTNKQLDELFRDCFKTVENLLDRPADIDVLHVATATTNSNPSDLLQFSN